MRPLRATAVAPKQFRKVEPNTMRKITFSIVTPVYSGAKYLADLVREVKKLKDSLASAEAPWEIVELIFVDDASRDGSAEVLAELTAKHEWVRVIQLARNFGQHPATIAGILHTSGEWVATLDEDLQHDPKFLPQMLAEAVMNTCDITYAKPEQHVHQSILRDWGSRSYKYTLVKLTGIPHIRDFNSFRVMRGSVARATASVCGHETYFDVALCWFSNKIRTIYLPLKDQRYIDSKSSGYSFMKLLSHARRLIVSTQTKVLRIGFLIGLLAVALSFGALVLAFYNKFIDPNAPNVPGWASLFVAISFFCGLSIFLLVMTMEYIRTILLHIQGKPTFFVVDRTSDKILADYFRKS